MTRIYGEETREIERALQEIAHRIDCLTARPDWVDVLVEIRDTLPGLRDYFAAAALIGIICEGGNYAEYHEPGDDAVAHARRAYRFADAMLAERKRGEDTAP